MLIFTSDKEENVVLDFTSWVFLRFCMQLLSSSENDRNTEIDEIVSKEASVFACASWVTVRRVLGAKKKRTL